MVLAEIREKVFFNLEGKRKRRPEISLRPPRVFRDGPVL
jgi:hypothetical protein